MTSDEAYSSDRFTLIAIAVIAYASANLSHEIIGHCGTMALLGGKCSFISTTDIRLAPELPIEWTWSTAWSLLVPAYFAGGIISIAAALFGPLPLKWALFGQMFIAPVARKNSLAPEERNVLFSKNQGFAPPGALEFCERLVL